MRRVSILVLVMLIAILPVSVITYFSTQVYKASYSVTIKNNSKHVAKKIFLRNAGENFFIKPIEPGEEVKKVLIFNHEAPVSYSITLNKKEHSGELFKKVKFDAAFEAQITIGFTDRISVETKALK